MVATRTYYERVIQLAVTAIVPGRASTRVSTVDHAYKVRFGFKDLSGVKNESDQMNPRNISKRNLEYKNSSKELNVWQNPLLLNKRW